MKKEGLIDQGMIDMTTRALDYIYGSRQKAEVLKEAFEMAENGEPFERVDALMRAKYGSLWAAIRYEWLEA